MVFYNRTLADGLFWAQLVALSVFGLSEFFAILVSSDGISISWLICWELFLLVNLFLAVLADKEKSSRVSKQTIIIYAAWIVMIGLDIFAAIISGNTSWAKLDTIVILVVLVFQVFTPAFVEVTGLPPGHPLIKAYHAVALKAVPQLALAAYMLENGGHSLSLWAILAGHLTICLRLGQIYISISEVSDSNTDASEVRDGGEQKFGNRKAMMVGEVANEVSWAVVTIAWIVA